jgi:hypothetical protein
LESYLHYEYESRVPNDEEPNFLQALNAVIMRNVAYSNISNNEDAYDYLETPVYDVLI